MSSSLLNTTNQSISRHHPVYHFRPAANWMNDPCGLLESNGVYHLFYQCNPVAAEWGRIHWGHAVSADLVHWTHRPVALTPGPNGPDQDGCWSGCAVEAQGTHVVFYTGVRFVNDVWLQSVCAARSVDEMQTWEKFPGNPLIVAAADQQNAIGFRDPFVWREDNQWNLLLGSGTEQDGGRVLLYRSSDLESWEYIGPLLSRSAGEKLPLWTGFMWECPQLVTLQDRALLVLSVHGKESWEVNYPVYFAGSYHNLSFVPNRLGRVDYGSDFYAASVFALRNQRVLLWAWSWEARSAETQLEAGWAGVLALPRTVELTPDGELLLQPIPELEALRGDQFHLERTALPADTEIVFPGVAGDCLELGLVIDPGDADTVDVEVLRSAGGQELTRVQCDLHEQTLTVDRRLSSLDPGTKKESSTGPLVFDDRGLIRLRIFVDKSIVEVFAGTTCITSRVYPVRDDSRGVSLRANNGRAELVSLDAWRMQSVW